MSLERNAMPTPGPQFFRADDGTAMFQFVIDGGNIIGPRPATKADQEKHQGTWAYFLRLEAASTAGDASDGPSDPPPAEPAAAPKPTRGPNRHQRRGGKA